jgi:hypothetical protein
MDRHSPHNIRKTKETARLLICYRNLKGVRGISHIGLGINSVNTARVLRGLGYWVEILPCMTVQDIRNKINETNKQAMNDRQQPISTVVIAAPWASASDIQALVSNYPHIDFAVVSHSNVAFLQADPQAVKLLREYNEIQLGSVGNFRVAGNCIKFTDTWSSLYGVPMLTLPNLYDVSTIKNVGQRTPYKNGPVSVGIFGAERPLKNMLTAVAAAIELGKRLNEDVEIWMSSGRTENGGSSVGQAIQQMVSGLPHVTLRQTGWLSWPQFRQVVEQMHVLLNMSYTESFCLVCADGVAEGVASVVGEAIYWTPPNWQANSDNASDVANVAYRLLFDTHAVNLGQSALRSYTNNSIPLWTDYLGK